ncbi:hypothetical protein KKB40_02660, partial [Patescibacteria group bacterium]|nr:hypothetical protein [Patescibacteria group bacterium]
MSLLRDIQNAAVSSEVEISTVLRKCKVLSARLGNKEFKKWIDQELNGYEDKDDLPNYRILTVQSKGHFSGPFNSGMRNGDISLICLPKKFRESLSKSYCAQPISAYEALIKLSKGENLQEQWPIDLVALYGEKIYQNMNCFTAWKVIPYGSMVALVDTVRNKILNFVIEIESEAPDAGEAPINQPSIPPEKISQVFHTTIYGNVGNIADGSSAINQTANVNVSTNDISSLEKQLQKFGIPASDIKELKSAIKADNKSEVIE